MLTFSLSGRVGQAATIGTTKTNKALNFSVCNSEMRQTREGMKEFTQWFSVVAYYPLDNPVKVAEHLKEGKSVSVSGSIAPAHWVDKDGQVKNKIIITANRIELL
jgi:single-stranded DNA-binding protein